MDLQKRKKAFGELGNKLEKLSAQEINELSTRAINENPWFTKANVKLALSAWAEALTHDKIEKWTAAITQNQSEDKHTVGLVMAGNIPMVGLHDLLSVIISGHKAAVKLSSQDSALMQFVIRELIHIEPRLKEVILMVDQLNDVDAVIATGSDNTARYFKQYFSKKPHIIRQNRTSVAVINGKEKPEAFADLGKDIFSYYGLGCRNVSKVYVPKSMDLTKFIDGLMSFEKTVEHHKYHNNYDYNKSIYLVNGEPHLDSGFFLMRETTDLVSPISVLYYETYDNEAQLALKLATISDKTQCIVSEKAWYPNSIGFGEAQSPALWDYADGINTLDFLSSLN